MMAVLLSRRPLILTSHVGLFASIPVPVHAQTDAIVVRLSRPTTISPRAWDSLSRVRIHIVLDVDGREHRCTSEATGGIRTLPDGTEAAESILTYRPTWGFFGERSGFPRRLGETHRSRYEARVEVELLSGSVQTEVEVASTESPAPRIAFRGSVAFDAVTDASEINGDGTLSLSHTAMGSDLGAFAGVTAVADALGSASVTYGGTGMTEQWDLQFESLFTNAAYTLAGPATGAQTVTSTLDQAQAYEHALGVITMTSVDQTTPVGTPATGSGTTSPASVTVGSVNADDLVVDNLMTRFIEPPDHAVGADQTQRYAEDMNAGVGSSMRGSTQPGTAGGIMSWTFSDQTWRLGGIAFKPAAGGAAQDKMRWPVGAGVGGPGGTNLRAGVIG